MDPEQQKDWGGGGVCKVVARVRVQRPSSSVRIEHRNPWQDQIDIRCSISFS